MDQTNAVGRIGLELRIGITGHRALADPAQVAADVAVAIQRILAQPIQALALTAEQQIRGEPADWYSLVRLHKPDVPA